MTDTLAGIRVLELAGVLAGPTAGQFLAELGATVVKVENARTHGDVTRTWRLPTEPETDRPAYFCAANWGKRSVALDLSRDTGREALATLVDASDVVLTAYKPGDAARLGADAGTLRRSDARRVVVELSGYGPEVSRAGYDAVIQAEAGFTHLNGEPSGAPTKLPVALMDLLAAHQIKEAVLAALFRRERTGEGAHVHLSLMDAALAALANQGTAWLVAGHDPERMGSAHPQIAPYGTLYPTRTGSIVLAVGTDRQLAALCEVLDVTPEAEWTTNPGRVRDRARLGARLAEATAPWDRDALLAELHARSIPVGAVRRVSEALADADHITLRAGDLAGLRQAPFAKTDLLPPPRYAEHSVSVLREAGVPPGTLARWVREGGVVDRAGS
ncbi:MAG: CoA transferase [Bacteroidota bacterium]